MNETQMAREMHVTTHLGGLYVRAVGDPGLDDVLIIVHGGPGLSHRYMLGLEQLASDQLAVVNYDQRGTGRSLRSQTQTFREDMEKEQSSLNVLKQNPTQEERGVQQSDDFALLTYAQDLEAVRSVVAGRKNVHLLGHSWGGLVAMYYAALYPKHIRSLLLIDSVPLTWSGLQAGLARFQTRVQALQHQGIMPVDLPEDPREQMKQIFPVYLADPTLALPVESFEYDPLVGQQTWETIQGFDLTESVANLDRRVLILWGEDDPFGRAWAEETKAALANASVEFVLIPQCGHLGWMECPDAFFRPVQAFLGLNG